MEPPPLPAGTELVAIIARDRHGQFVSLGAAGVQVLRLGRSWLVSLETVDPTAAADQARRELARSRGEPFNDQDLFDDGTGWRD
jgi:hypothetical protein